MLLQMVGSIPLFGILMLFICCPDVHAKVIQEIFPNMIFEVFSAFITDNFGPKISLSIVLMLLFTLNENTDLLNMQACSQHNSYAVQALG